MSWRLRHQALARCARTIRARVASEDGTSKDSADKTAIEEARIFERAWTGAPNRSSAATRRMIYEGSHLSGTQQDCARGAPHARDQGADRRRCEDAEDHDLRDRFAYSER